MRILALTILAIGWFRQRRRLGPRRMIRTIGLPANLPAGKTITSMRLYLAGTVHMSASGRAAQCIIIRITPAKKHENRRHCRVY